MQQLAVKYEAACRLLMVIFVVNTAMIIYTVRGAVILGFFPALAAAHSTYRAWLLDVDQAWSVKRTLTTFGGAWRTEFRRATLPGLALTAGWLLLWIDHRVLSQVEATVPTLAASAIVVVVLVFYAVFTCYFWVLRANFDESNRWLARLSAQMVIARPLTTVFMVSAMFIFLWLATVAPALVLTIGPAAAIFASCAIVFSFGRVKGLMPVDRMVPADDVTPVVLGRQA